MKSGHPPNHLPLQAAINVHPLPHAELLRSSHPHQGHGRWLLLLGRGKWWHVQKTWESLRRTAADLSGGAEAGTQPACSRHGSVCWTGAGADRAMDPPWASSSRSHRAQPWTRGCHLQLRLWAPCSVSVCKINLKKEVTKLQNGNLRLNMLVTDL